MPRYAPTIHTDPARIAAMEALLPQLDGQTQVELTLTDGSMVRGTVTVRPTVQQFKDADENEGTNGQLRLDSLDGSGALDYVWLDQIRSVRVLPPVE